MLSGKSDIALFRYTYMYIYIYIRSHFGSRITFPVILGSPQPLRGGISVKNPAFLVHQAFSPLWLSLLLALPELLLFTVLFWLPWFSGIIEQQVLLVEKSRTLSAET